MMILVPISDVNSVFARNQLLFILFDGQIFPKMGAPCKIPIGHQLPLNRNAEECLQSRK